MAGSLMAVQRVPLAKGFKLLQAQRAELFTDLQPAAANPLTAKPSPVTKSKVLCGNIVERPQESTRNRAP
jgi:hypothetical protein